MYEQIAINGQADISLSLSLLVPKQDIVPVDTYADDTAAMWREIDAAIAAGDTPVALDEPYEMLIGSAALGDEFDPGLPAQHILDSASTFMAYANAATLDRFTLDFTLDVDNNLADTEKGLSLNPPITDGPFHVAFDTVRITPLSTDITLHITPGDSGLTLEEIEILYRDSMLYNSDTASRFSYTGSWGMEARTQPDGSAVLEMMINMGPRTEWPETIYIVPITDPFDFENPPAEDDPIWQYAIPIRLP